VFTIGETRFISVTQGPPAALDAMPVALASRGTIDRAATTALHLI
jgi:hypothetical protein